MLDIDMLVECLQNCIFEGDVQVIIRRTKEIEFIPIDVFDTKLTCHTRKLVNINNLESLVFNLKEEIIRDLIMMKRQQKDMNFIPTKFGMFIHSYYKNMLRYAKVYS